ncbi:MAG: AI-2E family transporter [Armatimonadota bacterium]|nr:AI-2E family transporter [Armatimonadota bacterium]MDW8290760.1 AI-2E family transporter [Armatimonadota bacterium]
MNDWLSWQGRVRFVARTIGLFLLRLLAIALAVYVVVRIRSLIVTFIVAGLFAYPAGWMVNLLCRLMPMRVPRKVARPLLTLAVFVLYGYLTYLSIKILITPFQAQLSALATNWPQYQQALQQFAQEVQAWYGTLPPDVRRLVESQNVDGILETSRQWVSSLLVSTTAVVGHIVEIVLIPVLMFYFLTDSRHIKHEFVALLPRRWWREALWLMRQANLIMENYVIGQIILCLIAGVVVGIGLALLGVKYTLVLAVLAGITRAIPIIGPIIGGIPIILLVALQFPHNLMVAVHVLIFFTALHFIESKLILPILIGERVNLHPVTVIVVLLVGAQFFGLMGMFLAPPVAATIRVALHRYWIAPQRTRRATPRREPVEREEVVRV